MTQAQIDKAIAKGVVERKQAHWDKLAKKRKEFQEKIMNISTFEGFEKLRDIISNACGEHHHSHDKNVEYKHYEDAGYDDGFIELYDELYDELYERKNLLEL
jgi:hypothetical protein